PAELRRLASSDLRPALRKALVSLPLLSRTRANGRPGFALRALSSKPGFVSTLFRLVTASAIFDPPTSRKLPPIDTLAWKSIELRVGPNVRKLEDAMNPGSNGDIKAAIAGLGMAGNGIVRSLSRLPGVTLVAASDLRENALAAFRDEYKGRVFQSIERLCDEPEVEAVWVATPTHLHCRHAVMLANAGKHV